MIEVKNIIKTFKAQKAIDGVSFQVSKSEIFGIVGPDGAGKSTLLRMMAGILIPDKGTILINGESIFKNTYLLKEHLAYMPQKFGLYEDLTVEENIFFFGKLFGVKNKEIKNKLIKLYEFSNLEPFKKRRAGKLSGGMKQKLGLACCLVHNPDIILLDEPTNGVDPISRREFWKILYDLLSEGVTIVISTAYLDEAERCNRVALLHNGRIIAEENPQVIKTKLIKKFIEVITSDSRKAERVLKNYDEFSSVIITGATLKLFVDDAQSAGNKIKNILNKEDIKVISLRENSPGLEDCFVEILSSRQKL